MNDLLTRPTIPKAARILAVAVALSFALLGASRSDAAPPDSPPGGAPPTDTPGFDLPRGSITGTLIRSDTSEPVGRMWLTLQKGDFAASTVTDTFGRYRFERVPVGDGYQVSFNHDGYKVRGFGPISVKENAATALTWKATPVDPEVAPYTYSDTYLPGENVAVMVRSIRVTAVTADIYRLGASELTAGLSKAIDRKTLAIPAGQKPILSFRQPVSGAASLEWRTTRIEPAFQEPGVYAMFVSAEGVAPKIIPVVVTRIALITKRTPTATWVWATDLATGAPIPNLEIRGEAPSAPASLVKTARTDKRGLARFDGRFDKNVRYWGFRGPELAYVDTIPATTAAALGFRAYVYTDRPVYRPKDDVSFKVVARANDEGVYRVVPEDAWEVIVRDPEGEQHWRGEFKTNLFGTFAGHFALPRSPALGLWTIEAVSGTRVEAGSFKVLEYRKPEYKLDIATTREQFVQGDPIPVTFNAAYFFGAPLKGATVSWTLYETAFTPWWYEAYEGIDDSDPSEGYGVAATSGTATLDDRGIATVNVDVDRASIDRWVTIEATVTDATNREVTARHRVMVTRGDFRLELSPSGKIFQVGETAVFGVEASEFKEAAPGGKRALTATASLESYSTEHKMWIYETIDSAKIETDATGKTEYRFPVKRDGFIRIEIGGKDKWGNPVVESAFIWATKNSAISGGYKKKSLEILTDRGNYQPGDKARILVNTAKDDAWVLFTLEGDGVFEPQVQRFTGNSRLFEVALTDRHAPNVFAAVTFAADKQFYALQRSIAVSPAKKLLKLEVTADKRTYLPGETATYAVAVTDRTGAPVKAELSAALVDESIYSISGELAPAIDAFFYGHRPNPVQTAYSFPSRYLGGADKDGPGSAQVRKTFKDTAYWNANVVTGDDGKTTFKVKLPDNLTTWRLTLRAATTDTLVGTGTHAIRTAKDLMASVALPRFARRGDRFELVTMVHNRTETLSGVKVSLAVEGAARLDGEVAEQVIDIPGGQSKAVRWPVAILDDSEHGAMAKVRVSVSAGKLTDAEERVMPVYAVAVERRVPVSGITTGPLGIAFQLPEGLVPGTAELDFQAAPSLAGTIMASVEALAEFPYGCVEQTLNSFLPDLVASAILQDLGVPRSGRLASIDEMVLSGLRRLAEMQNEDGSFGWFGDEGSAYLTATVLYGWSRAEELGWDVNDERYNSVVEASRRLLESAPTRDAAAFILYALAHVPEDENVETVKDALRKIAPEAPSLGSEAVAMIVLAQNRVGLGDDATRVAEELRKRVIVEGDSAYVPGRESYYGWMDNTTETTAYVLRALQATGQAGDLAEPLVRHLMRRRHLGMWDTTKDTAAALEALTEVVKSGGELEGAFTSTLALNGAPLGSGKFVVEEDQVATSRFTATASASQLRPGRNTLELGLEGKGTLYASGEVRFGDAPVKSGTALQIRREYRRVDGATTTVLGGDATLKTGDTVEVKLVVSATRAHDFVAIEDMLPAGFELVPGDVPAGMVNRTDRDDRVAFFATRVPEGDSILTYRLRAEIAGQTSASPAVAWLMYRPDVLGSSDAARIVTAAP
ncbi:MAG: hypothetical protein IV100_31410 [Myxococcales bacterium]|nr:hypothetical protein [Myxococcales bacterium]